MNRKEYTGLQGSIAGLEGSFAELKKLVTTGLSKIDKIDKVQNESIDFMAKNFGNVYAALDHLEETKSDKTEMEEIVERVSERKKNEILGAIDAYAKRSDDRQQEHDMLVGQVRRHESWIEKIAVKTDVKLDY